MSDHLIRKLFFSNDVLTYKPSVFGMIPYGKTYQIGLRCGPEPIDYTAMFHEICHFVQRPIHKLEKFQSGWGFYNGKFKSYGFGNWFYETYTDEQVRTEMIVWAFQYNLMNQLGFNITVKELVSSAIYLGAWDKYGGDLEDLENEVIELSKIYTFDKLMKDFNERIDYFS